MPNDPTWETTTEDTPKWEDTSAVATEEPPAKSAPDYLPPQGLTTDEETAAAAKVGREHPILENAAQAAVDVAKEQIPRSVEQAAGFLTPAASAPREIATAYRTLSDVFGGKPVEQAAHENLPEAFQLAEADKTAPYSEERFKAGLGEILNLAIGAGAAHGLSKTMFPKPEPAPVAGVTEIRPAASEDMRPVAEESLVQPITPPEEVKPNAIEEGIKPESSVVEHPIVEEGGPTTETSSGDRVEPSTEKPQEVVPETGRADVMALAEQEKPAEANDWTSATEPTEGKLHLRERAGEAGAISLSHLVDTGKLRERTPLDEATGERSAKLQKSFADAERAQKEIRTVAPTKRIQNAMSAWREAKGDQAVLQQQEAAAKGKMFKQAAKDAQSLTPEQIAMTNKVGSAFDILERRGNTYDVLTGHRENYVPHIFDVGKKFSGIGSSKLQDRFKFNKAAKFENFFEADQAGIVPKTMALGEVFPAYLHEMNKVIADRQFVQGVAHMKAADERPLVIPRGNAKTVDTTDFIVRDADGNPLPKFQKSVYDTEADAQAALKPGQTIEKRPSSSALVNPRGFAKAEDAQGNPIDQKDYKVVDQPALNNWRWVEGDPKGNTTILKSDLAVHPELAKRLNATMGQSAFRQWYNEPSTGVSVIPKAIVKGLDTAQAVMKREMFSLLAPFHQVQEGTHAVGHTVNPFFGFEDMSRPTAKHLDAMQHGLQLQPDRVSSNVYTEGVGGRGGFIAQAGRWLGEKTESTKAESVGKVANGIASVVDGYQQYLFHQYIPALKFKTYEHMLERNLSRYEAEIKSGKVTESDVKQLSAEQANAAYGHLNYALLDRNPTMQHLMQLGLLAPDFLEARSRFVAQGAKALIGEKGGREQFRAIAVLAATQAASMYTIAHLIGGEWDAKHPFELTYKNRRYMLRSVPEDLHRLFMQGPDQRREFVSARINPVAQKVDQLRTGLNYRGEKTDATDTMEELLANYIPITARSIPGVRQLTETSRNSPVSPLEQLAGSSGLKISRYSPITKTHQLAAEWMDSKGMERDRGSYPVSKYLPLRYALEDADMDRAKEEWQKLTKGADTDKLAKGFHQSIEHPFTKSKAGDEEFAASLDKPNRLIFDHAQEVRKGILYKFDSISGASQGPKPFQLKHKK